MNQKNNNNILYNYVQVCVCVCANYIHIQCIAPENMTENWLNAQSQLKIIENLSLLAECALESVSK